MNWWGSKKEKKYFYQLQSYFLVAFNWFAPFMNTSTEVILKSLNLRCKRLGNVWAVFCVCRCSWSLNNNRGESLIIKASLAINVGTFSSALLPIFLFIPLSHLEGQIADNQLWKWSANLEKRKLQHKLQMGDVTWPPYQKMKDTFKGILMNIYFIGSTFFFPM